RDIRHISTGAMLRDAVTRGTHAGLSAKEFMDKGALVPDDIMFEMLDELFTSSEDRTSILLDGFPRNVNQVKQLEILASKHGTSVEAAICIDAPGKVLISRLGGRRLCPSCGAGYHTINLPPKKEGICDNCGTKLIVRNDDKPETIKHRLKVYKKQTEPLTAIYKKTGKLHIINGAEEMDKVAEKIENIINH
ncbi:MAG: nucleoside monophosphate kinase, partial [Lentisphaerae bacterium]|nr:nucleoside monophosphate kinase [Lentisphaerota bacterium]